MTLEVEEALSWLAILARPCPGARPNSPAAHQTKCAADILAHIDRQREEIAGWKDIADSNRHAYEEILPFVQRQKIDLSDPDVCRALAEAEGASEVGAGFETVASLSSQLERQKAELLTAEEAQHALDQIPDNQCGWPPKDCPVCDSLREKLRRQSDTGAHQEETRK